MKLKEGKVVRGRKLRIDTTVVESDIYHPTDTGLLVDGVRVITRVITRLKKLVPGIGGGFVKHTRKVKKIYLGLMKVMKGRIGKDGITLKKARDKLVKITEKVIADAQAVQAELEMLREKPPLAKRLLRQMGEWIEVAEKVVWQTKEVMAGNLHLPPRIAFLMWMPVP